MDPQTVQIVPGSMPLTLSFYECLKAVAIERIYIEMIEPPSLDSVVRFQQSLIENNAPVFYAVDRNKVVGWCDITPYDNPRMCHRGGLGMGLLSSYRGKGLGTRLVKLALEKAKVFGLEKVELDVYSTNAPAIALCEKCGFEREGLIRNYRKLDGRYFDCIAMAKFV